MNYYNPYHMMNIPLIQKPGLNNLIEKINIKSIINGTQKTLNIINQTIPIIKEVTPMLKNAKTMFKLMNEFKKVDAPTKNNNDNIKNDKGPKFFI